MNRALNIFSSPTFHAFLFCFFLLLLGWPLLTIADRVGSSSGFFYLFLVWGVIILTGALIAGSLRSLGPASSGENKEE